MWFPARAFFCWNATPLIAVLIDSVPAPVNTISVGRAPSIEATVLRARTIASFACRASPYVAEGLPYAPLRYGIIASSAEGCSGVVAA